MESELERAKLAYVMLHPLRYRIVKVLAEEEPLYLSQIAEKLGDKEKYRKVVMHHLLTLSKHSLVESEYAVRRGSPTDEKGRLVVVSYYKLTDKAKEILEHIKL